MKLEIATTPTEKFRNAKCIDCIHFWTKPDDKALCTHPKTTKKTMKVKSFIVCDYYEE